MGERTIAGIRLPVILGRVFGLAFELGGILAGLSLGGVHIAPALIQRLGDGGTVALKLRRDTGNLLLQLRIALQDFLDTGSVVSALRRGGLLRHDVREVEKPNDDGIVLKHRLQEAVILKVGLGDVLGHGEPFMDPLANWQGLSAGPRPPGGTGVCTRQV